MSAQGVYQVVFHSYENDLDSCRTHTVTVNQKSDVNFYVKLGSLFKTRHAFNKENKGLGNGGVDSETLVNAIEEVVNEFRNWVSSDVLNIWEGRMSQEYGPEEDGIDPLAENFHELLVDMILGYAENEGYYGEINFCRAIEYIQVFWMPQLPLDVTKDFL